MVRKIPRKTVYAATLITILGLAGGWTLAAGTTAVNGPAQNSSVTVTAPNGFSTAVVQSTQMMSVSSALVSGLNGAAGVQAGSGGHGLNSSKSLNALLTSCAGAFCEENFSAVDTTSGLTVGDSALQVMLTVTQPTAAAVGFDVQVEIIFNTGGPSLYSFGTGYFDSNTAGGASPAFFAVALYVDLGTAAINLPSISDVVVTMNSCLSATICP